MNAFRASPSDHIAIDPPAEVETGKRAKRLAYRNDVLQRFGAEASAGAQPNGNRADGTQAVLRHLNGRQGHPRSATRPFSSRVFNINTTPSLSLRNGNATVTEGQTAANTGTSCDIDGDRVILTRVLDQISSACTGGTWSWTLPAKASDDGVR